MFTTDPNLKISNNLKSEDKYIFFNYADFYIEIDQKPIKMSSEIF